jgi:hypothetical protein
MKEVVRDRRAQCDGKKQFDSFDAAQRNTFPADTIYRCPHCQMWHLSGTRTRRTTELPPRSHQLYAGFDDEAANFSD